jgi:ferredoxin-NADP reductase/mono/diheme cytochrome c family protein
VAAINVWLILESMSRGSTARRSQRLMAAHRLGGYIFIAIFCVMIYYMAGRLGGNQTSGSISIHFTLALLLAPLLFVKVLLARRYRNQASALMPLGLLIFVLSFVVVAIAGFPYLSRRTKVEQVSLDQIGLPPMKLDVTAAASLMQQKCSKCHTLDRVVGAMKDAKGWATTIARMEARPDSGITDADARTIAAYLTSRSTPENGATPLTVARAIIDQRCSRCHTLERVYSDTHPRAEWQAIVSRMEAHAAGSSGMFRPGEAQQIVDYLAQTQSPDAAKNGAAAPSNPAPSPAPPAAAASTDFRPIGLGVLVLAGLTFLAVRRPGTRPSATSAAPSAPAAPPKVPAKSAPKGTMVLKLIDIMQQTSDSKTLRFALPSGTNITARPGQFLSFTFLFDGRKETRCYSICSSPARTGYIEITPKRAPNGCVSVYLNESAATGLTVDAAGPYGEFCLDPERHRKIVLIAAGSGMTPMMAMLRYIDDLRLDIDATLLYCVRNAGDVFFQVELEEMQARMKSFRYIARLSDPPSDWTGWKGRISAESVRAAVSDFTGREVFICGPAPFMETARAIVLQLGASAEHVQQERFAGPSIKPPAPAPDDAAPTVTVEFAKSGKTVTMQQSQAILQIAEDHDVSIPFSCRQGQCGTCKTRLVEGSVVMDSENGLDDDSRARGFVLTCVGHPSGNVRLDA